MAVSTLNPTLLAVREAGKTDIQGQCWLHSELETLSQKNQKHAIKLESKEGLEPGKKASWAGLDLCLSPEQSLLWDLLLRVDKGLRDQRVNVCVCEGGG